MNDPNITPEGPKAELPANYGLPDCECQHCKSNRASGSRYFLNHYTYKAAGHLSSNELNRVALPGDVDYDGVCLDEKDKIQRNPY